MSTKRKPADILPSPNETPLERWYCVSRDGLATLCKDEDDANDVAAESWVLYPQNGPYRAARLVDAAAVRAALQEADNILGHDDAATEWRERWAHLWPWGGPNVEANRAPVPR